MAMKVKRMLVTLAAALSLVSFANPVTAYAYTGETEDSVLEETFVEDTETEATETDSSFSVSGNGEVLDDITDDSTKEFFTITTENGNTYFLVIDRSSSSENVYMLSMIDEYDLQDFLEDADSTDTTTTSQGSVVLEEQTSSTVEPEETLAVTEDEESSGSMSAVLMVLLLAAAAGGGAYFYFKVYKPKHDADAYESEGMEIGDGLETINEDEAEYNESSDESGDGYDGDYDDGNDSGYDDGYT